jgi:hypothetical protein
MSPNSPTIDVQRIRKQAGLKGPSAGKGVQNVLAMVLPTRTLLDYMELRFLLPRLMPGIAKSADEIGTLHFANFVDWGNAEIAFFTIYDGDLDPGDWRRTNPRFGEKALQENLKLVATVKELAREKGATPAQLALAWVHSE